ncbi:MAG: PAS domain S-box protein, partial [Ginsengibacter sp.]
MDRRLQQINSRLIQYSQGNFKQQLKLSPFLDEIDAISAGINMVIEELKATTISKDYFSKIFNSVSDMVFITDTRDIIKDVNSAAEQQLQYSQGTLAGKNIQTFFGENPFRNEKVATKFENIISQKSKGILIAKDGNSIPVSIKVSSFKDSQKRKLHLITASDISFQIREENKILRAIIVTQEKERQRFAKDMHDSLIQKLYAVKFQVNSILKSNIDEAPTSSLPQLNRTLTDAIKEVRNICFNLMPKVLEEFGLIDAI